MELLSDTRIGNVIKHYLGSKWRRLVQIPDPIRKCVAFVMYESAERLHFAGTVFFVGFPDTEATGICGQTYAVTAKHVIDAIQKNATNDYCYLRLNFLEARPSGRFTEEIAVNLADWFFHPSDSSVDVAVAPVSLPGVDHLAYPLHGFMFENVMRQMGIGIGDDVFIVGLFPRHTGSKRNIPIIRAGNIAAMPEEPINTKFSPNMSAYLIEARSFGGLSGSPVFVHIGVVRVDKDNVEKPWHCTDINATHYLLGLVHGHWDMPLPDTDEAEIDEGVRQAMNTGIAIVVPTKKILEVLFQPELTEMRKKREALLKEQHAAVMDAVVEAQKEAELFTKEDFEKALKRASRPKSDEETT